MKLPPPIKLGLPPKFKDWRKGQSSSVLWLIDCPKRFPTLNAPVGSGKSLTYAAYLRLTGGRAVILTSTKSLQDQLAADFASLGFVDVRGQSNYPCPIEPGETVDLGPCHAGYACDLKRGGCPYYDAQRIAYASEVTITNYSWWLYHNKVGEPYPAIDTLILDEAHAAPDELADFLSCTISKGQIRTFLSNYEPPITSGWRLWAKDQALKLEMEIEGTWKPRARSNKSARRELRSARMLLLRLQSLSQATSESDWVVERAKPYKGDHYFRFDPTWPGPYSEQLFRKTKKVILVSATIRPKTLELLNIKPEDYEFKETASTFPISRRPVIFFTGKPRVALTYRSNDATLRQWIVRIDNIIRRRLDRKGLLHCVSYARRDFLLRNSKFAEHFIIHDSGQQQEAVARFKAAKAPAIFLSPSATTGLDFPYQEAEWGILCKVPFPDLRSKILQARARKDRDYSMYLTAVDIVQASGRGMRAEDDSHEFWCVDDQIGWFFTKYKRFFPGWWIESVKRSEKVLDPLPKLPNICMKCRKPSPQLLCPTCAEENKPK